MLKKTFFLFGYFLLLMMAFISVFGRENEGMSPGLLAKSSAANFEHLFSIIQNQ
jgi:hypothetical protein